MKTLLGVLIALTFNAPVFAATFGRACVCDCDADGAVTVDEIILSVEGALTGGVACESADRDHSGQIDVTEVVSCITPALGGCPLVTVADAAFWDTLGMVENREQEAIDLYAQAVANDPTDARSWFLKGMMHFYRFGKELTDYVQFNDAAKQEIVLASEALDRAVEEDPANRAYPGFQGGATFQNGLAHGNQELIDLGVAQLEASVALWGFFNRFSYLGTIGVAVPAHDPLFAQSYQYLLASVGPDGLAECTPNFCGNSGKAPSNLAGTALLFGDLLAKAGDREKAIGWYRLGGGVGGSTYPFANLLRDRVQNGVARIALYADDDPSNDPQVVGLGGENCVICHAR